ncbi:unnamed protein product [Pelagomonas calceolata]|uniref:Uncharacterized protein n=1 Tax=Pelagomonas calceolata TaxID=35677 RepID=A0A7S4A8Q0_9STRA|nr:unnamed protein product [Pelagomonas calceolata]|mmetsp:Transcript_16922/g.48247  ORF Transcript_16922/g.48247 Transcript_16922/m.48247 type:complete len:111 (+) Transcript_16922:126-458(+)
MWGRRDGVVHFGSAKVNFFGAQTSIRYIARRAARHWSSPRLSTKISPGALAVCAVLGASRVSLTIPPLDVKEIKRSENARTCCVENDGIFGDVPISFVILLHNLFDCGFS